MPNSPASLSITPTWSKSSDLRGEISPSNSPKRWTSSPRRLHESPPSRLKANYSPPHDTRPALQPRHRHRGIDPLPDPPQTLRHRSPRHLHHPLSQHASRATQGTVAHCPALHRDDSLPALHRAGLDSPQLQMALGRHGGRDLFRADYDFDAAGVAQARPS